ncbi:MAG TPA: chemotaxis protein CheW [Ideonella sp.]|nr:chemotaxis protein CheW [Ideonella sp.]
MSADALICRVGGVRLALPLDHVCETLRPLPVQTLAGAPSFVRGTSVIRDVAVPIVDTGALLGATSGDAPRRVVLLRLGNRHVGLTMDEVFGVRALATGQPDALPPLLDGAVGSVVSAISALDGALLLVLQSALALPESVWPDIGAGTSA